MRALLDVSVLIALLDAAHVHHGPATSWLSRHIRHGWSSCPITQRGCVRIMSEPAYPNCQPTALVAERLRTATRNRHHEFWSGHLEPHGANAVNWQDILSSRQVTDAYLLALAVARGGCFVSFDRRVPLAAVPSAGSRHVVTIE